jgi:hypothetical protein
MASHKTRHKSSSGRARPILREEIRRITILPAYQIVRFSPGSQISFRAADQNGNDVTGLLTWACGDPQLLRAEQGLPGVFTPLGPGCAEIHAYYESAEGPAGQTEVTVRSIEREAA